MKGPDPHMHEPNYARCSMVKREQALLQAGNKLQVHLNTNFSCTRLVTC